MEKTQTVYTALKDNPFTNTNGFILTHDSVTVNQDAQYHDAEIEWTLVYFIFTPVYLFPRVQHITSDNMYYLIRQSLWDQDIFCKRDLSAADKKKSKPSWKKQNKNTAAFSTLQPTTQLSPESFSILYLEFK